MSVIVNDLDNVDRLFFAIPQQFHDEPKLLVEAHRVLVLPLAFQLLEVQRAIAAVQLAFIASVRDDEEAFLICRHDSVRQSRAKIGVGRDPLQVIVCERHFHIANDT